MLHDGVAGYHVLTPLRVADAARARARESRLGAGRRRPARAARRRRRRRARTRHGPRRAPAAPRHAARRRRATQRPAAPPSCCNTRRRAELGARLGEPVLDYQLLLDAAAPDGYVREWRAPGLAPERHLAYAGPVVGARRSARSPRRVVMRVPDREAQGVKHKSFAPWLVALVCFGPFAAALFIYYGPFGLGWLPQLPGSRELLRRARAVAAAVAERGPRRTGPWQLIYARMTPCEQQCVQHLGRLRPGAVGARPRHGSRAARRCGTWASLPQSTIPELTGASRSMTLRAAAWSTALGAERMAERPRVRGRSARRSSS